MNSFSEEWLRDYQARRAQALRPVEVAPPPPPVPAEPIAIRLELPLPPSVNALYANVPGKGRVKTKAYREWIRAAIAESMLQSWVGGRINGSFTAQIDIFQRTSSDIDNRIKATLDICKTIGAIRDDRYLVSLTANLFRGEPKVVVRLKERGVTWVK